MLELGKITRKLNEKLSRLQLTFTADRYVKAKYLQKRLMKSLRIIRRHYSQIAGYNRLAVYDRWIYDNYYLIDKTVREVCSAVKGERFLSGNEKNLPDLVLFFMVAVCDSSFVADDESLSALVTIFEHQRYLRNFEYDFMKSFLQGAAIIALADAVKSLLSERHVELLSRLIGLLSTATLLEFDGLNREKNKLETLLMQDPAGVYPIQTEQTKQVYRYKVAKAAFYDGSDELALASHLLNQAQKADGRHIGFFIWGYYDKVKPKNPLARYHRRLCFFLPAVFSFLLSGLTGSILAALLLYLPLYELCRPLIEWLCLQGSETTYPPRLALNDTLPEELQTLVVISTLLPGDGELENLYHKLRKMILQNRGDAIGFCLLCDLKGAKEPTLPEDSKQIAAVKKLVKRLNEDYGDRVLLLVRNRTYSKTQREYTGWERKRGAITELVELLSGTPMPLAELYGNTRYLYGTRYILALDYDTQLKLNVVSKLVSIAAHPLNRPVIDTAAGIVTAGYGIIAPRMALSLKSSLKSWFSLLMGGMGGTTTYEMKAGELYQDLYDRAIFSGKGIIDVRAYHELLPKRFLEETLLSHDILEGGFLRTLFVGDTELIDAFPAEGIPFFKRLHRWIRGDFQNAAFLFPTVRLYQGRQNNPLDSVVRFQLFDNLRRAITPTAAFLCLSLSLFARGNGDRLFLVVGLLSACAPYIYALFGILTTGSISLLTTHFYSKLLPRFVELMVSAVAGLALLPQFAWTGLDGMVRGLYRRFVSKRNMLEWSTAAQVERQRKGIGGALLYYLPQLVAGGLLLLSGSISLQFLGGLFLLVLPILFYAKRSPVKRQEILPEIETELKQYLGKMLGYYTDYAGESDHYLPPDNMQQAPIYRVAHRTSPTNIGLMLLSYLTARDFDRIDTPALHTLLSNTLKTVESLKKYKGNLYNWYDTQTCETLKPEFVSTVDSGNFICCLVALKEGLREYRGEQGEGTALIKRIEELIGACDLSVFYDRRKHLFSIGYDAQNQTFSSSHYDMLMSEARMTSYFAIAKRQVPVKHWTAFNRTLSKSGGYAGPLSWTGTMFEYFMPELLLHNRNGSIGYEALYYCIRCQKMRAKKCGVPFGISESGIYAFDAALNYQYSPNGVQKLALKRGMDDELIISPYSSYLTLGFDLRDSFRNLKRLERMHATGEYGHYEALDYTKERVGENGFALVKSYMAHHIGMSIVAINNALHDNIMQKRFLRDKEMDSATELLNEKIAVGEIVFSDLFKRKPQQHAVHKADTADYVGDLFPQQPRVKLLTNNELSAVLCDSGGSFLKTQGADITRRPTDLLRNPKGSFCFIKSGDKVFSTTFAPMYETGISYETAFSKSSVEYFASCERLKVKTEVRLHHILPCEQRAVTLQNRTAGNSEATLLFYMEPCLFPQIDDAAHPAFSKLFLQVERDTKNNVVVATRKKRGTEEIFYLAVGFREELSFDVEANRENLFTRTNILSVTPSAFTQKFSDSIGIPDPCIALRTEVTLSKNESKTLHLLTAVAASKAQAVAHLVAMREQVAVDIESSAKAKLQHASMEHRVAQVILPQVLFNKRDSTTHLDAIARNQLSPQELWQYGISVDFPIVTAEIYSKTDTERVKAYLKCYALLKMSFIPFDLVFLYDGEEETRQTLTRLTEKYAAVSQHGGRAGVHLLDKTKLSEKQLNLVAAASCHIATRSLVRIEAPLLPYKPITIQPCDRPGNIKVKADITVEGGAFCQDSFYVTEPPKLPWCHILANPTFGTLVSDKALGFSWAVNARENKLTPWYNDTLRDNTGEQLILKLNGNYYDLINGSAAEFSPRFVKYHSEAEGLRFTVTVTVPAKGMIKYIEIVCFNPTDAEAEFELAYFTEPVMGVNRQIAHQISGELTEGALLLHNPFQRALPAFLALSVGGSSFDFCCDRAGFLCGRWNDNRLPPFYDNCAALVVKRTAPPAASTTAEFQMAFATSKKGALALLTLKPREEYRTENSIQVSTADKAVDAMVNTWLPWQIASSRLFGRTGFYQCGGAYGFRDQLQDVCGYLLLSPQTARRHILRCCASQFEAGDVFHWWHTLPHAGGGKRGVRTRYSDDMVWLTYTVARYIRCTGDRSILSVKTKYLVAEELAAGQKDSYQEAIYTDYAESVYEHCKKALKRAMNLGKHDMVKIGGGDWNDGYSNVGAGGEGESVWLTQFLAHTMKLFGEVCEKTGDVAQKQSYEETAAALLGAVDRYGYDGSYYLRAYYDNGDRMGSRFSEECRIDSLPQSFAAIAEMPNQERVESALNAAFENLVDRQRGIIRLFTPSFDKSNQEPGYVKAYPTGIRENGGQYTHAAVWLAIAACIANMPVRFFSLTEYLNPIRKCQIKGVAEAYQLEPYYMAADIYTNESLYGRGGWSIYTGTASWYYQLLVEYYLGLRFKGDQLQINPMLPSYLYGGSAQIRYNGRQYDLKIERPTKMID